MLAGFSSLLQQSSSAYHSQQLPPLRKFMRYPSIWICGDLIYSVWLPRKCGKMKDPRTFEYQKTKISFVVQVLRPFRLGRESFSYFKTKRTYDVRFKLLFSVKGHMIQDSNYYSLLYFPQFSHQPNKGMTKINQMWRKCIKQERLKKSNEA